MKGPAAACAALLLALLAAQTGWFIVSHSNTFDEPPVIAAGYAYVKTGRLEIETKVHPPLLKYLFGLAVSGAEPSLNLGSTAYAEKLHYKFGLEFLYENSASPESLLSRARLVGLGLSLAAAACLCAWAAALFGPWGGVLALAAYVLEPNILAHSGLANMDMAVTAFLFIAYRLLAAYLDAPRPALLGGAGILAGCAAATKLPGVFFFAWSGLLAWWRLKRFSRALKINLLLAAAVAAVLTACYQVRYLPAFGGLLAQMVPAIFTAHPTEQHFNYLLGETKIGGWRHYYLVALAVKTPLAFLALAAWGFTALTRREKILLGLPALSYVLILMAASKQNGVRYLLPAFPFMCMAAGALARAARGRARWAVAALVASLAWESAAIAPNYLAYFNQIAGGPANGHHWLVDSNLDWGQDFPAIRALIQEAGGPELIVATLGNGDRDHWFGPHQDLVAWTEGGDGRLYRHANSPRPAREWLVLSASFLHGMGLSDPEAFAWLRGRAPLAQPGYSSFVYDITDDGLSHFNIGKLYLRNARYALAERQFKRAAALSPERPEPKRALADVRAALGAGSSPRRDR